MFLRRRVWSSVNPLQFRWRIYNSWECHDSRLWAGHHLLRVELSLLSRLCCQVAHKSKKFICNFHDVIQGWWWHQVGCCRLRDSFVSQKRWLHLCVSKIKFISLQLCKFESACPGAESNSSTVACLIQSPAASESALHQDAYRGDKNCLNKKTISLWARLWSSWGGRCRDGFWSFSGEAQGDVLTGLECW